MKKYIVPLFLFLLLGVVIYFGYEAFSSIYNSLDSKIMNVLIKTMICVFIAGIALCALVYDLIYSSTLVSLESYKRELEKESINKTESSSRVKVLESKIEVLEKALEDALKNG